MKTYNVFLALALWVSAQAFADCNIPVKTIKDYKDGRSEASLVRKGLITQPSSNRYLSELDEAVASKAGYWECFNNASLFHMVAERKGVPDGDIMYALAMTESMHKGKPSPWAINVHGHAFYFNTRQQAYEAAQLLLKKNIKSFDVGWMQVNWRYHSHRFNSLWDAFQPSTNIDVAADILLENYASTHNWAKAITWYHNRVDKKRGQKYFARFMRNYNKVKKSV